MNSPVAYGDLTQLYALDGVVLYPALSFGSVHAATAQFLASIGLPNDKFFTSRTGVSGSVRDPYVLAPLFALEDRYCPEESQSWHVLGYLPAALIAIDPSSGTVYIFQEGAREYQVAHRDVAALVHCLIEFRKLEDAYNSPNPDVEELVETFREAVAAFDPTPLTNPESEWNRMLDEVLEELW
ncbi:SUKH-4 family immunity protein [Streptomyces sp. NPDC057067]|uniref:SUKH-4 family immunity protein n=1 Tax=Streptomyces TaxID=1883 RepID=UPI0019213AEB|nr:SUKH-4 family immunity protein [Streptomyces silvae]MBL1288478.1 SUKH-4 family immunity protein [Streptomyces silvae]